MNSIGRSKAWSVAVNAAKKLGLDPSKARPHELLLFAQLSTSNNQYILYLNHEDQKDVFEHAEGLLDRDAFIAVGMSLGIVPVEVASSVEITYGAAPTFWPDKSLFTEATSGIAEYKALEGLYWGKHSLKTNEGLRIDRRPNLGFRTVQQTQFSATTANMQNDQEIKEIGAPVRFGGGDENQIIIDLKVADKTNLAGNATRNNYIFVGLYGAIIKGASTKVYTT